MNTTIEVRATVFPNKGVTISFDHYLQVSLDCAYCSRTDRTVIFNGNSEHGSCTASSFCDPEGWHEYSGRTGGHSVVEKKGLFRRRIEYTFFLNYEYTPVIDKKYASRVSSPLPRDMSITLKATCPKCHLVSERQITSWYRLPEVETCACGYSLYTRKKSYPMNFKVRRTQEPD